MYYRTPVNIRKELDLSLLNSIMVKIFTLSLIASLLCQPVPLPLEPRLMITGIIPSESSIFKSALHPLRLTFQTKEGGKCKIIFKKGDDLRQDQLV
jgi:phosphatidylinositol kinase/protein kinase (PI-3  family)